jgi:FkbM family methyltransferase
MNTAIKTNLGSFTVDKEDDVYAKNGIFENFLAEKWEPDTALFIRKYCDSRTIFLDIGASNGIFTLYASLVAKKVYAFEPLKSMFIVAAKNIALNPTLNEKISLQSIAISNETRVIQARQPIEPKILSSITHSDISEFDYPLHVKSLITVIQEVQPSDNEVLVIKMDIEGAEFKILQDPKVIDCLANNKAVLLVAFHPGFSHPMKKSSIKLVRFCRRFQYWARNVLEILSIIQLIPKDVKILRTNQAPVGYKKDIVLLLLGGYNEFIFDFSAK